MSVRFRKARVVTATDTFVKHQFELDDTGLARILDRSGNVLVTIEEATGERMPDGRLRVEGVDAERTVCVWLASDGCGCGEVPHVVATAAEQVPA